MFPFSFYGFGKEGGATSDPPALHVFIAAKTLDTMAKPLQEKPPTTLKEIGGGGTIPFSTTTGAQEFNWGASPRWNILSHGPWFREYCEKIESRFYENFLRPTEKDFLKAGFSRSWDDYVAVQKKGWPRKKIFEKKKKKNQKLVSGFGNQCNWDAGFFFGRQPDCLTRGNTKR